MNIMSFKLALAAWCLACMPPTIALRNWSLFAPVLQTLKRRLEPADSPVGSECLGIAKLAQHPTRKR